MHCGNWTTLITIWFFCIVQSCDAWFWNEADDLLDLPQLSAQNGSAVSIYKRQACDFRCGSGECIMTEQECDGKADCRDGSDETAGNCGSIQCPSFLFQCNYGACIQKNQVCDGEKNCADGSDEQAPGCKTTVAQNTCNNFEFRCTDGTCIDNLNACDGVKNCPDGSDETEEACTGLVCPTFLYRCAYGACVSKNARCNGVIDCADGSDEAGCGNVTPVTLSPPVTPAVTPTDGSCLLPRHPPNGKYELTNGGRYTENTYVVASSIIVINCNPKYKFVNSKYSFCLNNRWDPPPGHCIPTCPSLQSTDTYDVECRLNGANASCVDAGEGTIAILSCKPYYTHHGNRPIPYCVDGAWDPYPAPCDPECGQKIVNAETLVIGGSDSQPGEYPWIAAIYNTSLNQNKHICGGSIISRFFVLSAAHCFCDQKGTPYDKSFFTIVAGKYYRDFDKKEPTMQVRQIKRLYVHDDYKGRLQKYRDDIALIEVERFEVTLQVQPVCLDWVDRYENNDFKEGNKAVVGGWGFTSEGSSPAEILKKLIVPFRSTDTCRQYMDPDFFQQYYSSDKICAGYKDEGQSVCSGDSGGGLFFRSEPITFYVRAVVSLAPRRATGCDSNHYALYTKVSKYLPWIELITRRKV